nr:polynucleotide kinase [Mycolicibacterium mengxianglii]
MVTVVQALAAHPTVAAIVVISGRPEAARELTSKWLTTSGVPFTHLFLRADQDRRPDSVVKEDIYREQIEPSYSIMGVIDDRDKVVGMWRRAGLTCFQVADGDF